MIPPKIILSGNRFAAQQYLGQGKEFLRRLKHEMGFQDLSQGEAYHELHDEYGTLLARIQIEHRFGESVIKVYAPTVVIEEEVAREREDEESEMARFFVKCIRPTAEGEDPEDPLFMFQPQEQEYDYFWVEFNKETGKVKVWRAEFFPEDLKQVGRIEKQPWWSATPDIHYNNYGGKSFELKGKRFVGYTGCVGLLFRMHEEVHRVGPDLENNSGIDFFVAPVLYWPNYHKFHLLNSDFDGQHIAWYFYRQYPHWVLLATGEYDWRFSKAEVYVCKIVGLEAEMIASSPRMSCHGAFGYSSDRSLLTSIHEDDVGSPWVSKKMRQRSFSALDQYHQMSQGAHAGLDIESVSESGLALKITLYQNHYHTLAKLTYRFMTEEEAAQQEGYLWHRWRGKIEEEELGISSSKMLVWDKDGSKAVDSLNMVYDISSYQRFPVLEHINYVYGPKVPSASRFGYGPFEIQIWMLDYIVANVNKIGGLWNPQFFWSRSTNPTGGRASIYNKEIDFEVDIFGISDIKRRMKMGELGHCVYVYQTQRNASAYRWQDGTDKYPDAVLPWGSRGYTWIFPYYHSSYIYANTPISYDDRNLGFEWYDMFNDMNGTGCEIFCPNVIQFKGEKTRSIDQSRGTFWSDGEGTLSPPPERVYTYETLMWKPWERSGILWLRRELFGASPPEGASLSLAHEVMHDSSEFSAPMPSAEEDWNLMSAPTLSSFLQKRSYREGSDGHGDISIKATDGENSIEGMVDDAYEYFFMDDRSTEDSQGVFMLTKIGTERKFYHFWDYNSSMQDVTDQIMEGLGYTTNREKARIHCIGLA